MNFEVWQDSNESYQKVLTSGSVGERMKCDHHSNESDLKISSFTALQIAVVAIWTTLRTV